eukprot:scaffold209450_cov70-Attheya_sp.AAC.1
MEYELARARIVDSATLYKCTGHHVCALSGSPSMTSTRDRLPPLQCTYGTVRIHSRTSRLAGGFFHWELVTYSWYMYTPCSKQGFEEHSRTMLPLTTVWAFTIWKSQGQTFTVKVVLNVIDHEREHGLTYVAFSHATGFQILA